MPAKEFIKRYILFMISLFFSAFGIAVTKHASLGVAPSSAVPDILFCGFSEISLGLWLIIWNIILLIAQMLILRRSFRIYNLLQIPLSVAFGIFTDFGLWCISSIRLKTYYMQIAAVFLGVIIRSFGIALSISADIILNSGEAFVKALSDRLKYKFGIIKIITDIGFVAVSVLLSLAMFGEIISTREGTLIACIFTGIFVSIFLKLIHEPVQRFVSELE